MSYTMLREKDHLFMTLPNVSENNEVKNQIKTRKLPARC